MSKRLTGTLSTTPGGDRCEVRNVAAAAGPPFSKVWKASAGIFQRLENECPQVSNVWKFPDTYARARGRAALAWGGGWGGLEIFADVPADHTAAVIRALAPAFGVALVGGCGWFPLVVWLALGHRISRRSSRFSADAKNGRHAGNP